MFLKEFWNRISRTRSECGLYSSEQMKSRIANERARADRTGTAFSLVLYDLSRVEQRSNYLRHLSQTILGRKRLVDEVGWISATGLGVLLPDTPASGAWKQTMDIVETVSVQYPAPACRVYVYPFRPLENDSPGLEALEDGIPIRPSDGEFLPLASTTDEMHAENHPNKNIEAHKVEDLLPLTGTRIPLWKRSLDIVVAVCILIFLLPLLLVIMLVIKFVSSGPVLHRQERVGYLGRPFAFWKFRTMEENADNTVHSEYLRKLMNSNTPMVKLDLQDDPRIFPIGSFLRQTCLDELAQLINVLLGDMSLVGPRPCLSYEAQNYLQWQTKRFDAVPGMTGLWQVSGKNRTTFTEMIRLDISYARNRSIWLDLKILLLTVPFLGEQIKMGFSNLQKQGERDERVV